VPGVNCSPALKWFLVAALALTLGSKLIVRPDKSGPSATDIQQRVTDFLIQQHFIVTLTNQTGEGQPMLHASAKACRILVANSNPTAWDRDFIGRHATGADRSFVVFRGRVYAEQPTWLTVPDFLWSRLQRELGLRVHAAPLLAVIATTSCNAERLPWGELG
jgi:hypothetical protein